MHAHRNQQPSHGSCSADHRRSRETRASQLSHGFHDGSSEERFCRPILPCTNVVVVIFNSTARFPSLNDRVACTDVLSS